MTYPTYRVYKLKASWTDHGDVKGDNLHFNDRMLRDSDDALEQQQEWATNAVAIAVERGASPHVVVVDITEYPKRRTWTLSWFSHWTFRCDEISTPQAALASFSNYVSEVEREFPQGLGSESYKLPGYVCLMGAEDRYRWRGLAPEAETPGDGNAPCSCAKCEEDGVWRIDH